MIPIVTPEEMAVVDEAAPEPFEVLVERAGGAVARSAIDLLGGTYGRRVVVVAGRGSNGADGRVAAARLRRRGVRTIVLDATEAPASLPADGMPPIHLVVDAAYGTGLGRPYVAPTGSVPVLAVDLPSGLDGLTGVACGSPSVAARTVTFGALKPGLLFADGPALAGHVEVAGIGLDVSGATVQLLVDADVADLAPAGCWPVRHPWWGRRRWSPRRPYGPERDTCACPFRMVPPPPLRWRWCSIPSVRT